MIYIIAIILVYILVYSLLTDIFHSVFHKYRLRVSYISILKCNANKTICIL